MLFTFIRALDSFFKYHTTLTLAKYLIVKVQTEFLITNTQTCFFIYIMENPNVRNRKWCHAKIHEFMTTAKSMRRKGTQCIEDWELTYQQTAWNDVRCQTKLWKFTLRHNAQCHLGQSEDWIFWVSLVTHTCNVWCDKLSRYFVGHQTSFQVLSIC